MTNRIQTSLSISPCAATQWQIDVPAKLRSAACIRAAVGRLQEKFGAGVPVVVAGDLNMQKVQMHYRKLTGRSLHSSTLQLNLSRVCSLWTDATHCIPPEVLTLS
jgi:endonuclease/exonuclease/phosphatase family metal-dependent hydrolase